ncbi:MAG: ABC transporter permease [Gammaproteobacteria bacterium]|nr:ABC transporter permease [Gammaproteobacteria bacterium]
MIQKRSQQIYIAFYTIIRKEIIRFMRIWSQTLLPPVITMSLYFLIFGKLVGSQIQSISGYSYMQYIVPGLVMMAIMTNAYANTSTSFFGAKFSKSIEEILVAPVPSYVILVGFMLGGTIRGLLVGFLVILISLFFTHLHIYNIWIVLAMAILASMLFSLGGLINGIFAKKFDDVSFIPTFVLMPLTYLGGVFYSVKQLPDFWRTVSTFNPILNIVDTFRFGILGISDVNVYFGFTMVGTLFIILLTWCLIMLKRGTGMRT